MEQIVLVDEQDNVIGTEEKLLVHQLGMLHRAFSIFVFRRKTNNLQVLLQKRQVDKYHSGGLWTNSCCGHPRPNENVLFAGERRIKEELGIDLKLKFLDSFIYKANFDNSLIEHELDHVLAGFYNGFSINPDPREVSDFEWINVVELERKLLETPNKFTIWLPLAWEVVKKNLVSI